MVIGTMEETTLTLGETARRLDTTVDGVLRLVYDGVLPAVPERATGRLLLDSADVESLREQGV